MGLLCCFTGPFATDDDASGGSGGNGPITITHRSKGSMHRVSSVNSSKRHRLSNNGNFDSASNARPCPSNTSVGGLSHPALSRHNSKGFRLDDPKLSGGTVNGQPYDGSAVSWKAYLTECGNLTDGSGASLTVHSSDRLDSVATRTSSPGTPATARSPLSLHPLRQLLGGGPVAASSPQLHVSTSLNGGPTASSPGGGLARERERDLIVRLVKEAHSKKEEESGPAYFATLSRELRKLSWLGQGGFGIVFQAEWKGAPVAVKFVLSTDEAQLSTNVQEAFVNKMLSHPNVVHTYQCRVVPVETDWVERASHLGGGPGGCMRDSHVSFTSPSYTAQQSRRGAFISSMFTHDGPIGGGREGSTVAMDRSSGLAQYCHSTGAGDGSSNGGHVSSTSVHLQMPHAGNGGSAHSGMGGNTASSYATAISSAYSPGALTVQTSNSGPSGPPTASGHGRDTGASIRRNSVASVDNFSLGGSFSYARNYTFMEAVHLLNCSLGQYLTVIVMEHCDRGSLQQAIHRGVFQPSARWGKGTALRATVRTARELAQGMCYLHSLGVIHGDLKPGNVLLKSARSDRRGFTARVSDFGYNKNKLLTGGDHDERPSTAADRNSPGSERASPNVPQSSQHMATLTHTAPEAVDGHLQKASDVYSFGVVLWEMTSGQAPFADMHWAALLTGLLNGTLSLEWPENTNAVIRKLGSACLKHDPAARPDFDTIATVLVKLEQHVKKERKTKSLTDKLWSHAPSALIGIPAPVIHVSDGNYDDPTLNAVASQAGVDLAGSINYASSSYCPAAINGGLTTYDSSSYDPACLATPPPASSIGGGGGGQLSGRASPALVGNGYANGGPHSGHASPSNSSRRRSQDVRGSGGVVSSAAAGSNSSRTALESAGSGGCVGLNSRRTLRSPGGTTHLPHLNLVPPSGGSGSGHGSGLLVSPTHVLGLGSAPSKRVASRRAFPIPA